MSLTYLISHNLYVRASGLLLCALFLFFGGGLASPKLRAVYKQMFVKPNLDEGRVLFLANCAPCHGLMGGGGRGPALVGRPLTHGPSEKDMLRVIQDGIPGSSMPAFGGNPDSEREARDIAAYVRSLSGPSISSTAQAHGDATRGAALYQRYGCAGCHLIGDAGSVFGPELTRVGAGRSYSYLKRSLLDPSAEITPGAEAITVTTVDGRRTAGIRINEDTFTVQLRDPSGRFLTFDKSELKEIRHVTGSLMPGYSTLPGNELEDLLAYLATLKGEVKGGAGAAPVGLR